MNPKASANDWVTLGIFLLIAVSALANLGSSSPHGDETVRKINKEMTCSEIKGTGYLLVQVLQVYTDRGVTGVNPKHIARVSCDGRELTLDATKYRRIGGGKTPLNNGWTYKVTVKNTGYEIVLVDAEEAVGPTETKSVILYRLGLINPRKNMSQPKPTHIRLDGKEALIPPNYPETMPKRKCLKAQVSTSGTPAVVSIDTDERGNPRFIDCPTPQK